MKKLIIIVALLLIQTQVLSAPANTTNTNYNKQPAQKIQQVNNNQQTTTQVNQQVQQRPSDNTYSADYLLKYNIDDLEAAPWLNGGKRKI